MDSRQTKTGGDPAADSLSSVSLSALERCCVSWDSLCSSHCQAGCPSSLPVPCTHRTSRCVDDGAVFKQPPTGSSREREPASPPLTELRCFSLEDNKRQQNTSLTCWYDLHHCLPRLIHLLSTGYDLVHSLSQHGWWSIFKISTLEGSLLRLE